MSLRDCFPFRDVRPEQTEALDLLERSDRKFNIFELPTGSGKSPIGVSFILGNSPGYILSPQKTLTAQYCRDFARLGLVELRGKSNYRCTDSLVDCQVADNLNGKHADFCDGYYPQAKNFALSALSTTNYAFFLSHPQMPKRPALVLDETHNLEDQLLEFTGSRLTQRHCEAYGLRLEPFREAGPIRAWLAKSYLPKIEAHWLKAEGEIAQLRELDRARGYLTKPEAQQAEHCVKEKKFLKRRMDAIKFALEGRPEDWFIQSDWDWNPKHKNRGTGDLILKPLDCAPYARRMFERAEKILIMSATILNPETFTRTLGIRDEEFLFHAWASSFPVEHRPIYYQPVGRMNHKCREYTLPKLAKKVVEIVASRPSQKGIIHTQSYENTRYLAQALRDAGLGPRVFTHVNGQDRELALLDHLRAPFPSVLLTPSMMEGVDLRDDASRFQIIVKVPYPYLGDPYIAARKERSPQWYRWKTALTLVQASGRSVRSAEDWADTYILDADFEDFANGNSRLLPRWWFEAVAT